MRKALNKLSIEGAYFNIIKARYDKLTVNIIFNGESLKAFPLRSRTRQGCPLSPLLFNMVLKVLARKIKKEKNKRHSNQKGEVKLSLFADDIILHIENPEDSTKKLLELINEFSNFFCFRIQNQHAKISCIFIH